MKLEFSRQSFENPQMSNFMNICPVAAELFHADGQTNGPTDRQTHITELMVAFRNFANAPKIATPTADYVVHVHIEVKATAVAYVRAGRYDAYPRL
jgi:hypothetical protein